MRIKIISLGCRLNEAEMQSITTVLREAGHIITVDDPADVSIINTCVVTGRSEGKTRRIIAREEASGRSMVIVAGCAAEGQHRRGTTVYLSNDYKHRIPDIIKGLVLPPDAPPSEAARFLYPPPLRGDRTRAHVKIQDGCDCFCAYCIIPYRRGRPLSRPFEEVVDEFDRVLEAGFKEVVLTGVMVGKYCHEGRGLDALLVTLSERPGEYRIHLSSLSPLAAKDGLIEALAHERVVKHVHLSLQSGSDRILDLMGRGYDRGSYIDTVARIRGRMPRCNITTDVIVGFPGESDSDFADTLDMIEKACFSHVHVFRYSPRKGTAAATLGDDVPENLKKARSAEVTLLSEKQKGMFYGSFSGSASVFLAEKGSKGVTKGYNEYYVPVEVRGPLERNRFYRVVTAFDEKRGVLFAEPPSCSER